MKGFYHSDFLQSSLDSFDFVFNSQLILKLSIDIILSFIIGAKMMGDRQRFQRSKTIQSTNKKNVNNLQVYKNTNQIYTTYSKRDKKLNWVCQAFGGSKIICFISKKSHIVHQYFIKHLSANKNFLGELSLYGQRCSYCMVSNDKLILLIQNTSQGFLIQWDLKTYQKIKINLEKTYEKSIRPSSSQEEYHQFQLFGFAEKSIIAVCGPQCIKKTAYVKYYQIPLKQNDVPFQKSQFQNVQKESEFRKLNHSSMIGIIPKNWKRRNRLTFFTYQLNSKNSKLILDFNYYVFQTNLPTGKSETSQQGFDIDIWQMNKNNFYIKFQEKEKENKLNSSAYIWNHETKQSKISNFNCSNIPYFVQFISSFRPQKYDLTFNGMTDSKANPMRMFRSRQILYVDPKDYTVINIEKPKQYQLENKQSLMYIIADFNPKIFITAYEKFQECFISTKKLMFSQYNHRMIITFMLKEMMKNCDEDLIFQIIQLTILSKQLLWIRSD